MQPTILTAAPATAVHPSKRCTVPACLYGIVCAVIGELQDELVDNGQAPRAKRR